MNTNEQDIAALGKDVFEHLLPYVRLHLESDDDAMSFITKDAEMPLERLEETVSAEDGCAYVLTQTGHKHAQIQRRKKEATRVLDRFCETLCAFIEQSQCNVKTDAIDFTLMIGGDGRSVLLMDFESTFGFEEPFDTPSAFVTVMTNAQMFFQDLD